MDFVSNPAAASAIRDAGQELTGLLCSEEHRVGRDVLPEGKCAVKSAHIPARFRAVCRRVLCERDLESARIVLLDHGKPVRLPDRPIEVHASVALQYL